MTEVQAKISDIIKQSSKIVVMQADNPDGDSLGSAIALEHILSDVGKEVVLYSGVTIPTYLQYIDGWDRVVSDFPNNFDATIIVDASSDSLFDSLHKSDQFHWFKSKPSVVIDHHMSDMPPIEATVVYIEKAVATTEVIYDLAAALQLPISLSAMNALASGIMSDSLGFTSEGTTANSLEIMSKLVKAGVNLSALDDKRKELMKKSPELVHYKGELLQRVQYFNDNKIAIITIPWEEIEKYSHQYNPSVLVLEDMRQTINTAVVIAFKLYKEGKVTAKIRTNQGYNIAQKLAEHFGGGGHPYASGFKLDKAPPFESLKSEVIQYASELLSEEIEQAEKV